MTTHLAGAGSRLSVLLYGQDLFFASYLLSTIMRYLARRPELLVDGFADDDLRDMVRRRRYGVVSNGIRVLLAPFLPLPAIAMYTTVAICFILQPLFFRRIIVRSLKKQAQ
ncbi:hypothetical protein FGU65_14990 [Methanoculleus sp. FWC-SCC1]|uniref:Uncharacterized protein n=1 Tax=Methanoculleus frigidifontis TaxID=2584085 RepID=A0ABT8ME00_9EURY|nr:hypothetical protein [Methanoculleus sp. FWC-SCC1]MDN7026167.1 hypothetical protein [Methanoculleus sp. FWC-SCC1]